MPPGQCRKSQGPSTRSCPSTIARQRPESTRKPSWVSSRWYMQAGSPGWSTPTWKPTSGKRTSPWKLRSEPPKPGLCCHCARLALSTYQPSPRGTSPCSVVSILASVMAVVSRRVPRFTSNPALRPEAVADPSADAAAFHVRIPGWRETPVRQLDGVARELGLAGVALKDESDRLGLPAFKVLGASWAVERALREAPDTRTLVAASAGNHGRAVAHVAAMRGLACRIFVPAGRRADRRAAIEGEGAELVVVDGDYEDAVRRARRRPPQPGALALADVGDSGPAHWVIDGYHTLFAEAAAQAGFDALLVPGGRRLVRRRRGPLRRARGQGRDRGRARTRRLRGRLAGGGRAGRGGDARDPRWPGWTAPRSPPPPGPPCATGWPARSR